MRLLKRFHYNLEHKLRDHFYAFHYNVAIFFTSMLKSMFPHHAFILIKLSESFCAPLNPFNKKVYRLAHDAVRPALACDGIKFCSDVFRDHRMLVKSISYHTSLIINFDA